jgi:site-specific recombinase
MTNDVNTIWYASIIGIALIYQGLMARYFLNRRADLARYVAEAPAWAREVVQSMAK